MLVSDRVPDPKKNPLLIEPAWGLWAGGRAGLKIDLQCRSTLPGLFAAGAVAKNDATGTHASAGSPTAFAYVTGWTAGEAAGKESQSADYPDLDRGVLDALAAELFAPLDRAPNGSTSDMLHDTLTALEANMIDSILLNETRLNLMVGVTESVLATLEHTRAEHLHDLVKLHEARSVAQCAQLVYRAALDRKESREQFYREDYPNVDDDNWYCWHHTYRTDQGIAFDREPIPEKNGWLKRPSRVSGPSNIAAVMMGRPDLLHLH